jgi:hypothetical protein
MSNKTIPFSARISVEDLEFISSLEYEGASTPSDKLRGLLNETRRSYSNQVDYAHNLAQMQEWFTPMKRQLLVRQDQLQLTTEITNRLLDSLPELIARLQTLAARAEQASARELRQGEQQLLQSLVRIDELVLPLAIKLPDAKTYPEMETLFKLVEMISQYQKNTQGEPK